MNKIRYLLFILLDFIKNILVSIFGFIFNLFFFNKNKNTNKKETSKERLPKFENKKETFQKDYSSFSSEEPKTREIKKANEDNPSINYIDSLIKEVFLEIFKIKEIDLTNNEIDYLNELKTKVKKLLDDNLEFKKAENKEITKLKIKNALKDEIEKQIILEKNNKTNTIVVIPLIKRCPKKPDLEIPQDILEEKIEIIPNINFKSKKETPPNTDLVSNPKDNLDNSKNKLYNNDIKPSYSKNNKDINSPIKNAINYVIPTNNKEVSHNSNLLESEELEIILDSNSDNNDLNNNSFNEDIKPKIDVNTIVESPKEIEKETTKSEIIEKQFETIDFTSLDNNVNSFIASYQAEMQKEELDDKNYEELELYLNNILIQISKLKLLSIHPKQLLALENKEKYIRNLKDKLEFQKQKDVKIEMNYLDENITINELDALKLELQKLYLEDKLDLQKYMLNSLTELESLSYKEAKLLEKTLLKRKLKKTIKIMNIGTLSFFKNKFFRFLTINLLANKELKSLEAILNRKDLIYEEINIDEIKKGSHALEDATRLANENVDYLNYLEVATLQKHPELTLDSEYLSYINTLKNKFLKNKEKLAKKEKTIIKYNLKIKKRIRKLKKLDEQKN